MHDRNFPSKEYGFALVAVAGSTAVSFAMFPFFALTNLVMFYLLGTLVVAARGHRGPAAFSAVLSVLCFDFFFVPPRFTFRVSDVQYLVTFVVMFVVAMIISHLTIRLRTEAESAREGQRRTAMMHAFTQQLVGTRGIKEVLRIAVSRLVETFDSTVIAFIPDKNGRLIAEADVEDKESGVAQWVYDREQIAGLGTQSLPSEDSLYVPLVGAGGSVGVLKLKPRDHVRLLAAEQRQLLDSFSHQIALALEVDRLQESTRKAEVEVETERLRSSLLSSVSHDFRTPLTAIVGSASALLGREEIQKNSHAVELLETIQEEGERLSRQIQNLLQTTKLESGIQLKKELFPLEEIVGSVLERLEKPLRERNVTVKIPEDLPAVPLDGILIEQVFMNLLENAVRHTPAKTPIEISAQVYEGQVLVSVADRGAGLKGNELEKVFEKFFHDKSSPGVGLGLAICRAIVKAHGGKIWAENRAGGGAAFYFLLPLENR